LVSFLIVVVCLFSSQSTFGLKPFFADGMASPPQDTTPEKVDQPKEETHNQSTQDKGKANSAADPRLIIHDINVEQFLSSLEYK